MRELGKWMEPMHTKAKHTPILAPLALKFCSDFLVVFYSESVRENRSAMLSRKLLCERAKRIMRRTASDFSVCGL